MSTIDILDRDQDEMSVYTREFVLWRRKWEECRDLTTLDWKSYKLTGSERIYIPRESGIYTLIVQPGIASHPACSYLIYVGQTNSLHRRFGEYLRERTDESGRPKVSWWLRRFPHHVWFYFTPVREDDLDDVENCLLSAYYPPANDQYPASVRRVINAF
jgi:hypothetical protein